MSDYEALLKRIGQRLFEIRCAARTLGTERYTAARKELLDVLTREEECAVRQHEREASA